MSSQGPCFFIDDFLNFEIKERSLGKFDLILEDFPVFKISWYPVITQCLITFLVPPALGVFCDVDVF